MKLEAKLRLLATEFDDYVGDDHMLISSTELLADTAWWDRMSVPSKVKYLKQHPRSKKDKSFVSKHLNKTMKDKSVKVRHATVTHPHASTQMLKKAMTDKSPSVRKAAERALKQRSKK